MSQVDYCARAGVNANTLSQNENAKFRPSLETAIALCDAYQLTLDWIYLGDPSNLPVKLFDAIRALRALQQDQDDKKPVGKTVVKKRALAVNGA